MSSKKPCKECPFRVKATPGWLGPWDVEEILREVHGEGGLACHVDVNEKGEGLSVEQYQPCIGSILHALKTFKNYRNPRLAALQEQLKNEEKSGILGFSFRKHHAVNK